MKNVRLLAEGLTCWQHVNHDSVGIFVVVPHVSAMEVKV